MKFFVDSANIEQIIRINELGLCDGVTTNPTLVAKEGRSFKETVKEICRIVKGPVSAEVVSPDAESMLKEAREIVSWADNVVIKVPMTPEGVRATRLMTRDRIRINMTLIFSVPQALIAAKAGADFISPFAGRLDDLGVDGMDLVRDCADMLRNYDFESEIITASVRGAHHITAAALAGAHIATVPPDTLMKLFNHPLTDKGLIQFNSDWEKANLKIFD